MGCDIHSMTQIQIAPGVWECRPDWKLFDDRNYNLFGVLANVRNYGNFPYISEPRGFPPNVKWDESDFVEILGRWLGDYSYTHFTLAELLAFDYEQEVVNSRSDTKGKLRDFLPDEYFSNLRHISDKLTYCSQPNLTPDDVRFLVGFDN